VRPGASLPSSRAEKIMPCAPCGMPLCAAGAERGESKGVYAAVSERGGTAAQRSRERGWWRCAPPGRQPCTARALARLTARNETLDPPPAGARPGPHGGKQVCERAAPTLGEVSGCREAVHRTPRRPSERSGGPPPGRPQGTLRSWPGLLERGAPARYHSRRLRRHAKASHPCASIGDLHRLHSPHAQVQGLGPRGRLSAATPPSQ
jgi:hypothetical protein